MKMYIKNKHTNKTKQNLLHTNGTTDLIVIRSLDDKECSSRQAPARDDENVAKVVAIVTSNLFMVNEQPLIKIYISY